jgi:hypothetical protein
MMKLYLAILAVPIGILAVAAAPAVAHHSFGAEFDGDQPFEFTGTVTKIEWLNPHVYFYLDIEDEASGEVRTWAMEMGSPNGLMRRGWTRNSLRIGDEVSVAGSKARDGSDKGNARTVVLASGRALFAGSSEDETP